MRRTYIGVGTALVATTSVLISGFATVLGSQMPSHRIFAGMAVTTLGIAMLGDMVLLPAMLVACYRHRKPKTATATPTVDEEPAREPVGVE